MTFVSSTPAFGCNTNLADLVTADQPLSGGVIVPTPAAPTVVGSNVNLDCGIGPIQALTGQTGAYNINAPSNNGSCIIGVTNNATTVGTVSFVGFSNGPTGPHGDTIPTGTGKTWSLHVWKIGAIIDYRIAAQCSSC
jgi:hypothetical protein